MCLLFKSDSVENCVRRFPFLLQIVTDFTYLSIVYYTKCKLDEYIFIYYSI